MAVAVVRSMVCERPGTGDRGRGKKGVKVRRRKEREKLSVFKGHDIPLGYDMVHNLKRF